jgi:divalent metal cation (Fe/Co/Zn/Cd) transporter
MASPAKKGDERSLPPKNSTVLLLLTMADTTWRVFIPAVGFTILGLAIDKLLATKPWLMILGIVLGAALAIWLVRLQMKKVKNI